MRPVFASAGMPHQCQRGHSLLPAAARATSTYITPQTLRPCSGWQAAVSAPCDHQDTYAVEPFSRVEIHMEMDMEWKRMEMGHKL